VSFAWGGSRKEFRKGDGRRFSFPVENRPWLVIKERGRLLWDFGGQELKEKRRDWSRRHRVAAAEWLKSGGDQELPTIFKVCLLFKRKE